MATKSFPYAVIYNGKFYPANAKIEIASADEEKLTAKSTNKKAVSQGDKGTSRKA